MRVLHSEREEFQQAIEEKTRYVQQAAAAQNALDVLHSEIDELEEQLAAAQEGKQQMSLWRSLSATHKSLANLGRPPPSHQEAHSPSNLSWHSSLPGSRPGSLPGSPRQSFMRGGVRAGSMFRPLPTLDSPSTSSRIAVTTKPSPLDWQHS